MPAGEAPDHGESPIMDRRPLGVVALVLALVAVAAAPAGARLLEPARSASSGMEPAAEVSYSDGMHLVVTRIDGHDYAIASSASLGDPGHAGIRFFDVSRPAAPKLVASLPCVGSQGFLQISHDGKTLLVGEGVAHDGSPCMPPGEKGFYTIDIRDPRHPKPLGYASADRGGHTLTTHPTKPIVYLSYGDVFGTTGPAAFEVWSIANPAKPKHLATVPVTGYHGPHDFAFNATGTRAVAASMTLIQVFDTTDPAKPKELEVLQCPGCSHNHEAHFTPDQKHVVVSDEASGGAAAPCPLGALYFYAWNAQETPHMDLVGEWQPAEVGTPAGAPTNVALCTSHVFDISPDGTKVAASWHNAGVRVVDITTMAGIGIGPEGTGAREIGWHVSPGADAWSAKFDRSGNFVFVNDRFKGFQVFRLDTKG